MTTKPSGAKIRFIPNKGFTMEADLKRRWVAALRSGVYRQTTGVLFNGHGYCCLGVLCAIDGATPQSLDGRAIPTRDFLSMSGSSEAGGWLAGKGRSLTKLNDSGTPFSEIADLIEKYVPTHGA